MWSTAGSALGVSMSVMLFFFSSRRRHTRYWRDWSSDVCSSDLTAGRVLFDGQALAELDDRELVRQRLRIGFLFQGAALFDSLSVYDNVAFGLRDRKSVV